MEPERLVDRVRSAVGADFEVALGRVTPSLFTPEGTLLESHLRAHARVPHLGSAPFATDGGNLARLGTRPLVFGPGRIEVAHQADEWIDEGDLHRAVDVVEDVIRRHCG
jgi:acetylornithine deacetylase/succinyl-diaminopimelate desuccinylase-like protein